MATSEKPKEATGEEGAAPVPPKKSNLKWIIVGVLVLFAVGGGGAFAWFKFMAPHKVEAKAGDTKASEGKAGEGKPGEAKPGEAKAESPGPGTKIGPIMDMDPFIVNLADTEPRFLKVTIKLELDGVPVKAEISERIPQVRDAILMLLSSKEAQALKPTAGKLQLRDEILQRINALLATGQARNAYFTEFVVQ
jgi:flagellar protein FliL